MVRLTDHEFLSLIANALHRSGPEGNAERASIGAAHTRAAALLAAIDGAGVFAVREERARYRRPWVNLDADADTAEETG